MSADDRESAAPLARGIVTVLLILSVYILHWVEQIKLNSQVVMLGRCHAMASLFQNEAPMLHVCVTFSQFKSMTSFNDDNPENSFDVNLNQFINGICFTGFIIVQ